MEALAFFLLGLPFVYVGSRLVLRLTDFEEVLEEGDSGQQQEAKGLIDAL